MQDVKTTQEVDSYLDSIGVKFSAAYVRETSRDNWPCDQWAIVFTHRERRAPLQVDFFTGLGHRVNPKFAPGWHHGHVKPGTVAYEENQKLMKPKAPDAASVLHSLILDLTAIEQPFSEWAADLGYSDDSIKAKAAYDSCIDHAQRMRRFFTQNQIEALSDMLRDY